MSIQFHDFIQGCDEAAIVNTSPVFDRQLYPVDIFHTAECQRRTGLRTSNQDSGLLRILLLDTKHPINNVEELTLFTTQLQSKDCGRLVFSRFIVQDPNLQTLKLVETFMGQLFAYDGKEYGPITTSDFLANHFIFGVVFHSQDSQNHELPPLETPHRPKVDEKHRVKQTISKLKRYQPDAYHIRPAAIRKSLSKKETSQPIVPCESKASSAAIDIVTAPDDVNRHPISLLQPDTRTIPTQVQQDCNARPMESSSALDVRPAHSLRQDGGQTAHPPAALTKISETLQLPNQSEKFVAERHQNKSPPRSPVHQQEQPKKSKSTEPVIIPIVLISLFDGIGSVLPTFVRRFRGYPAVYIAAEQDEELRQLISTQTGLRLDGQWTRLASGTIGIYLTACG